MKIGGRTIDCGPKKIELWIPRGEFGDIHFIFVGVTDDSDFEKLYPMPEAPRSMKTGVGMVYNVEDPGYKAKIEARWTNKQHWFFLKSIEPSGIEWDTVKMDDPSTWANWSNDLRNAGFSVPEINMLHATFQNANVLTDDMVKEARQRFLASQQEVPSA